MITIKIADLPIGLDNRFEYTERYVREFVTDEEPIFTVNATDAEIEREYEISGVKIPPEYAENVVMYRKIAEQLPQYGAIVFHGAILECRGEAFAITAHSGVGKTTHTRLWLKEFDDVRILNGDKPIIRLIDGVPYACSTPWRGKEGYGYNAMRPLRAIGFLSRAEQNAAKPAARDSVVMRFMNQVYLSKGNAASLVSSMRICDAILSKTPLFELECNMDPQAAHIARAAFTVNENNNI